MVLPSLFTSAGALTTQQNAINIIANNIANVNTTGFKSGRVYFEQEISNVLRPASSPTTSRGGTNPIEVGNGMRISDISTNWNQGPLKNTGIATDLALKGSGWFIVSGSMSDDDTTLSNPQYTRDGHFKIDASQNLVSADGSKVVAASLYDSSTGRIKSVDGYSNISYFSDQTVGSSYVPTNGATGNLAVPTPTAVNVAGASAGFDATKLAEISVRGGLVDSGTSVNTTTEGDLQISRQEDGKLLFTFDNANAGTGVSTFTAAVDTNQQLYDNVQTVNLTNSAGAQVQLRIRLEPGVTSFEDIFTNIEYDTTTASSDTLTFGGGAATVQSGSAITVGADDFPFMKVSDVDSLYGTVKIPNFLYTQDPGLEIETANYAIESDGSISILGPSSEKINLGRLLIANFTNPDGLSNNSGNKFGESSNSGPAAISVIGGPFNRNAPSIYDTAIVSGALETSNVNLANEFAELIGFQRGLQANSRVISASDEILQTLINL